MQRFLLVGGIHEVEKGSVGGGHHCPDADVVDADDYFVFALVFAVPGLWRKIEGFCIVVVDLWCLND